MTKIEIAKEILRDNGGVMTTMEIAEQALHIYRREVEGDPEILKNQFASALAQDIRNKGSRSDFRRIKNKQGGYQRGKYKLKITRIRRPGPPPLPDVSNLYTGKAGEHAVLSELLFFGYNASIMTVDDGIDIVASKKNNYFHIQVKTSSANVNNDKFAFSIKKQKFRQKSSGSTFYIFVMRRADKSRYFNDFVVLSSPEIKSYISRGIVRDAANLSFRIKVEKAGKYMLNDRENIADSVNKFNRIQ